IHREECDICILLKGKPAWSVEMLVLLVVLALVPTWSDGLLLKKCELKSQLEAALSKLLEEKAGNIIAKLVCTAEQTSGFNTSLVTITDQFNPRSPEDFFSGTGELPLKSKDTNIVSDVVPKNVAMTEEPLIPQHAVGEDNLVPGRDEVQPEKRVVHVDGQARKQREAPSKDERDRFWRSVESSGEGSIDRTIQETQERNGLDETKYVKNVKPQILPDPTDIYDDTNEMLFGSTVPPDRTMEPEDIYYDTYEMLFGPIIVPSDRTAEPEDIHYDADEMIFGARHKAMNPLDTTEPLEPEANLKRSKHSSEDQTTLYGIFQLSDMACNSESSYSLANLCGLNCSGE
ncbi:hypothetical protein QTP70_022823, partial [Hemibagrus guttatus]